MVLGCIGFVAGVFHKPISNYFGADATIGHLMKNISTKSQLCNALAADHCVMFVDVEWSSKALESRAVIVSFIQEWHSRTNGPSVACYRIDATAQEGPMFDAVSKWLGSVGPAAPSLVSGNGAVFWVRKGSVVAYAESALDIGVDGLMERTKEVFIDDGCIE